MIKLINGDCLDHIGKLKFDIVITDLPYNLTQNKNDIPVDLKRMWELLDGRPLITTAQQPFTTDLINSNRKGFKYISYWDKKIMSGHLNAKRQPMKHIEDVVVFDIEDVVVFDLHHSRYNPQKWDSGKYYNAPIDRPHRKISKQNKNYGKIKEVIETDNTTMRYPKQLISIQKPHPSKAGHPTQKPVELMEYLIKTYTKEGDTVLDLTMGSGTTGIACIRTKRNFIGIELNKAYYEVAKERINKEQDNEK